MYVSILSLIPINETEKNNYQFSPTRLCGSLPSIYLYNIPSMNFLLFSSEINSVSLGIKYFTSEI